MGINRQMSIMLIETETETQARVGLSDEAIAEYVDAIRAAQDSGEPWPFPPVDLFCDGKRYFVGDGWHRIFATMQTTIGVIPAILHEGGQREALLFAAGANSRHGLTRTPEDKARAVEIMLADLEWSTWSDRLIAEHCRVSPTFVGRVRRKVQEDGACDSTVHVDSSKDEDGEDGAAPATRVGKDGKRRKAPAGEPVDEPQASPTAAEPEPPGPNLQKLALPYRDWMAALGSIKRELKALAELPEGTHLAKKVTRVAHALDEARAAIRQAEPTALCGMCGGEGCQHCARTGFWTRFIEGQQKRD